MAWAGFNLDVIHLQLIGPTQVQQMLITPKVGRERQEIEKLPAHGKHAGLAGGARIELILKWGEVTQLKFDVLIRLFQPDGNARRCKAKLLRRVHGLAVIQRSQGLELADQFIGTLGHGGIRQGMFEVPFPGGLCGADGVGAVVGDLNGLNFA